MPLYSGGFNSTVGTTTAPCFDIKASATNSPRLLELAISVTTAAASTYLIGRPGNDGSVAQSSATLLQAEDTLAPAAQTGTAVAWSTAPTVPAATLRRVIFPNTVGAGIIWTFPRGILMAVSKGLVVWNVAANSSSVNFVVVVDE